MSEMENSENFENFKYPLGIFYERDGFGGSAHGSFP